MMQVLLARSAGFCYGVRRAVERAAQAAEAGQVYLLGHITHNDHVIRWLEDKGAVTVFAPDQVPPGATVLIRAHGEPDETYRLLEERGCQVLDATCPDVAKIHDIVRRAQDRGRIPIVVGEKDHPEVVGIVGSAHSALAVRDWQELEELFRSRPELTRAPLSFVCQTTAIRDGWEKTVENAKKVCTSAEFFDTICGATSKRQWEAAELAKRCDAMIVIGDPKSSNTRRLAQLCQASCPLVVQTERGEELSRQDFQHVQTLGITAGASTPEWIIKEVYNKMSDEIMEIEQSFAQMLEESFKTLNNGDKVTGTVVAVTPTEVQVELGIKYPGYIPLSELSDDPNAKVEDLVKVGDEIQAQVMMVSDRDCMVKLSKKRLDAAKNWEIVEAAVESKEVMEGYITEENKGGLVASVKGIRVFIPASQSGKPRGADLSDMVKTQVQLRITEVNRSRRRVVGSIRAVQAEARAAAAAKVWAEIEQGKRYTGTVKSLTSYGAFVDIGGVDGMVHISELSWSRIKNPAEVVSVGDQVEVYVISFDPEKKKISLGMKDHSQDPWSVFLSKYTVGDVATVRVVKLMTFGAFAEIVPGVDGLIHISQIADHRIDKPEDVLTEGESVEAKIIAIDEENQKVSLSIRALIEGGPYLEDEPAEMDDEPVEMDNEPAQADQPPLQQEQPAQEAVETSQEDSSDQE